MVSTQTMIHRCPLSARHMAKTSPKRQKTGLAIEVGAQPIRPPLANPPPTSEAERPGSVWQCRMVEVMVEDMDTRLLPQISPNDLQMDTLLILLSRAQAHARLAMIRILARWVLPLSQAPLDQTEACTGVPRMPLQHILPALLDPTFPTMFHCQVEPRLDPTTTRIALTTKMAKVRLMGTAHMVLVSQSYATCRPGGTRESRSLPCSPNKEILALLRTSRLAWHSSSHRPES